MRTYIPVTLASIALLASILPLAAQPYRDPEEAAFSIRPVEVINSAEDEYAPALNASGAWLYFTSSRDGKSNIYRSSRTSSGWSAPQKVGDAGVNEVGDDGALSLATPTLARLLRLEGDLLSRANPSNLGVMTSRRGDGAGQADLYMVKVSSDGSSLNNVSHLSGVNTSAWESQPAISPDGGFIIFSSVRDDGYGGMDLYIATRQSDGSYSQPVNLGPAINSDEHDVSPYIAPDGQTLFFASNGRGGYGGADIFVSHRNADGTWGQASNLGEKINTAANELFFTGPNREHCYFASDRGGAGGLDIFEGTPNIFAPGYATLHLAIRDTVKNVAVAGRATVIEQSLVRTLGEYDVSGDGVNIPVLSGYRYRIEVAPQGFGQKAITVADFNPETTINRTVNVGLAPPPPPRAEAPLFTCTFEAKDIPMFISGYYQLNTLKSLEDLRSRQQSGDLKGQTYIADIAGNRSLYDQYRRLAQEVERVVNTCGTVSLEKYFPEYIAFQNANRVNEYLEITVRAYADPRPVVGTYTEKPVTFFDEQGNSYTVSPGDSLDNFKLAGLRAYYSKQYLDQVFSRAGVQGSANYLQLVNSGVIRWHPVSGGVDEAGGSTGDINASRRIKVEFRRVAKQ